MLAAEQLATLDGLIGEWRATNPDRVVVGLVRFDDFAKRNQNAAARQRAGGSLKQIGDVATSVDAARLFGERTLWYAIRFAYLFGQQAELTRAGLPSWSC